MSSAVKSAAVSSAASMRSSMRPPSTRSVPAHGSSSGSIQEATRELANPTLLTKYVALAKAVQD